MENDLKQICIEITDNQCRESFSKQRKEILMSILDQIGDSITLSKDDGVKLEDISWRLIYNYEKESSTKVTLFNDNHIIIEHNNMSFVLRAVFMGNKKNEVMYFDSISSVSLKPKDSEMSSRIINERF